MGMCFSDDCINRYHDIEVKAMEAEEERQNKMQSDYENFDVADFEEAISNTTRQNYINLFDAFKADDQKAMLEAVKKVLRDDIELINPGVWYDSAWLIYIGFKGAGRTIYRVFNRYILGMGKL